MKDGSKRLLECKNFEHALNSALIADACCIRNNKGYIVAGSDDVRQCEEYRQELIVGFPYSCNDFMKIYGRMPTKFLDCVLLEKLCYTA